MEEIWRDIDGYEGLYKVSNLGNIKSLNYRRTGKEKILIHNKSGGGYMYVYLSKNGKQKQHLVHRLVSKAFIPNPNNYTEVNHKDEDKTNNRVENLDWCSRQYNNTYGNRLIKLMKPVMCIETGVLYNSITEAERTLNSKSRSKIASVCKGTRKTCRCYHWEFVEKTE